MTFANARRCSVVSELVGSLAVLVGLIVVGLELRNTTAAVESATIQGLMDSTIGFVYMMATNPELADLRVRASIDPDSLTPTEREQLRFLIRGQWFRFQTAYSHWRKGTLTDEDWSIYADYICERKSEGWNQTGSNIRTDTWDEHKSALSRCFVEYVESCRNPASRGN